MYAGLVPWEVVLPWGPPERFLINLSGTFTNGWPMSVEITTLPTRVTDSPPQRHPFKHNRQDAKKTKKETLRMEF